MGQTLQGLHAAFHRPSSQAYRVTTLAVGVLIVLSLGVFAAELILAGTAAAPVIHQVDQVLLLVFLGEYLLRVFSFRPPALDLFALSPAARLRAHVTCRLRLMLQPMMLVDLLTVTALIPALRGLRALRLLRLLRHAHLFRYTDPVLGIARAFRENRLLYSLAFSILGLSTFLGGLSMYLAERGLNPNVKHVADGFWWALVTLCTVGFGDIAPITTAGRFIGSLLMVDGLFILALFAGIVGHTLLRAVLTIEKDQQRMGTQMNHLVVCGYDPGAHQLLDALLAEHDPAETVVMVFAPGARPADLPDAVSWVSGDPTKESELDKVRVVRARAVIVVGARSAEPQKADAVSILTVFTIRRYLKQHAETALRQRPLQIVAEILDAENVEHARAAGADEVVETNTLGFSLLAHALTMPGTADILSRVALKGDLDVFVGPMPAGVALPRPFGEVAAEIRRVTGVLVMGIRVAGSREDLLNPEDERIVSPGDGIVYLALQPIPEPSSAG
jgi:voltage-gated potassium channel